MATDEVPRIGTLFNCFIQENDDETVIAAGNEFNHLFVLIWTCTTKTATTTQIGRVKNRLCKYIERKYLFKVWIDNKWQNAVYFHSIRNAFHGGLFDDDGLKYFDKMESIINIIESEDYTIQYLETNIIGSNATTVDIEINAPYNKSFVIETAIPSVQNGYLLKNKLMAESKDNNDDNKDNMPSSMDGEQIDIILKKIKFDKDQQVDHAIRMGIKTDLIDNFMIIDCICSRIDDQDKISTETDADDNKNDLDQNKSSAYSMDDGISIVLVGTVHPKAKDENVRVLHPQTNNFIHQYLMAFKLSNCYNETLKELHAMSHIDEQYQTKCTMPLVYYGTIRCYKYKNKGKAIMFGMELCSMDLYSYTRQLNIIKMDAFLRIKIKCRKVYTASIIAYKVLQQTKRLHTDIKSENILLSANRSKTIKINATQYIQDMNVLLADWGLTTFATARQQRIGVVTPYLGSITFAPPDIYGKTKYNMHKVLGYSFTMVLVEIIKEEAMYDVIEICCNSQYTSDDKKKILKALFLGDDDMHGIDDDDDIDNDGIYDDGIDDNDIDDDKEHEIIFYYDLIDLIIGNIANKENKRKRTELFILNDIWFKELQIAQEYMNEIDHNPDYIRSAIDDAIQQKIIGWNFLRKLEKIQGGVIIPDYNKVNHTVNNGGLPPPPPLISK